MKYLKQLLIAFKEYFSKKKTITLPDEINSLEPLGRYLLTKSQFSHQKKRVKYTAFMPNPNNLELSVFRISGLSQNKIWEIGEKYLTKNLERTLYGIARIIALKVTDNKVQIKSDNNPPRHANIVGWPNEKSEQKLIAQELAANAQLELKI
ncbi:MAG: hypothetical protein MRK01_08100 [Candidatus Scalindua sp.]|nr:hypothetical protein [Candidatus Scalindua sp.]